MKTVKIYKKKVFISYAWGGKSEEIANKIDEAFTEKDIEIIRDKRNMQFKGLIKEFMQDLGAGHCVIVVISDKYLKSENCMFELCEIAKNGELYDRIFPLILDDAHIYKASKRIQYVQHWESEIKELNEAMQTVDQNNLEGFREDIDNYE